MDYRDLARDLVDSAVQAGADEAEVYIQAGEQFHVDVRMREVEMISQASSKGLGLRVFVDKRMAFASSTDFTPDVLRDMVRTAVSLARAAGRDRYNGLPDVKPESLTELSLFDPKVVELPAERKIEMAKEAERAAFDYDSRIVNSHGASFSTHSGTRILANSRGILYSNSGTDCAVSCAPLAEQDSRKQIGYYWCAKRFLKDLDAPSEVGRQAAIRTVRKLGARKVETQKVPVVFDWMVGPALWGAVFSALDGDKVHRKLSFLRNKLGKKIASEAVTLIDDPMLPGGLGSMPFDGEGLIAKPKTVVDRGVLNMYFYDSRTARKYGAEPSGNCKRSYASAPSVSPTNFYLKPTDTDPSEIIRGVSRGFLVTETMGQGVNTVTGDFSVGASGIWIEDGELAYPVQEVTIAGNMLDMLRNVEQVANDARFISSIVSPTFKISEMTVSGR